MRIGRKTGVTKEMTRQEKNRKNNIKRLIVSAIVAFILFICLIVIEKSVINQEKKEMVYQVVSDISTGTKVTETNFDSFFKLKEVQVSLIPQNYITDKEAILNKFVNKEYKAKDIITTDGITDTEKMYKDSIENPVEVSFSGASLDVVVSGIIKEGDYINMYGLRTPDVEGNMLTMATNNLKLTDSKYTFMHVYVTKVFNSSGEQIESTAEASADEDKSTLMFNVIIREQDVEVFNEMTCNCTMKVAKVLYDTDKDYTEFVNSTNETAAESTVSNDEAYVLEPESTEVQIEEPIAYVPEEDTENIEESLEENADDEGNGEGTEEVVEDTESVESADEITETSATE